MIVLAIAAILWLALFSWMVWSCWRAPVGYEDGEGFHYGMRRPAERPSRQGSRVRRHTAPSRRLAV